MNEEASEKVLEVEQKYNEIRRPIYKRRNEIIQSIPDFWLTAVCYELTCFLNFQICWKLKGCLFELTFLSYLCLQFLSHPVLGDLLSEEDQKVWCLCNLIVKLGRRIHIKVFVHISEFTTFLLVVFQFFLTSSVASCRSSST